MAQTKVEQALRLHRQGFNCAQCVALPFCEEMNLDPQTTMRAMEGFGLGMGGMAQTCGALSAAIYLAGIQHSCGDLDNPVSKRQTYAVCKGLCNTFAQQCGASVCQEIKGVSTGKMLRRCEECIETGVRLVAEMLRE